MKKVSRKNLVLLASILVGFSIFVMPRFLFHKTKISGERSGKARPTYYCPMHPAYTSDRPGDCPICSMKLVRRDADANKERKILYYRHPMGQPDISPVPKKDSMGMDYIPVYEGEEVSLPSSVPGHAAVRIPAEKQQLIGVKLGTIEKRRLTKEIRTPGRVAYDPALFTAQQEFLSAVESLKKAKGGPYHEPLERAEALVNSSRTRLRLLGMSEDEVKELEEKATQDQNLILPENPAAPFTSLQQYVWVYGAIYEYELPFVKVGSVVKVRVPTFSDREFAGEVRALDPVLDSGTRSIRVRIRVGNPEGLLKPEMYVDVYLEAELGEVVAVPEEAVMQTGERALVFVSRGEGIFEPREVKLGAKAGNLYEVKSGIEVGDEVAVSGNFLIDSESRLQAALQGMTGGGGGHQHG